MSSFAEIVGWTINKSWKATLILTLLLCNHDSSGSLPQASLEFALPRSRKCCCWSNKFAMATSTFAFKFWAAPWVVILVELTASLSPPRPDYQSNIAIKDLPFNIIFSAAFYPNKDQFDTELWRWQAKYFYLVEISEQLPKINGIFVQKLFLDESIDAP